MHPETLFGMFLAFAALTAWRAWKQSRECKLKDDHTFWVPDGDAEMSAAMRVARSSLPDFLALAAAPRPSTGPFSIKVGIPVKAAVEYFWICPFMYEDGRFSGKIDSEPTIADAVKCGDTITFNQDQIVDWMYVENGRLKGNYTLCAFLKRQPREEAEAVIAKYRMDCRL